MPAFPTPRPDGAQRTPRPREGVILLVSTVVAALSSYAYAIVLSAALGPARYGAVGALTAAGVIGSVPAAALQVVVARAAATSEGQGRPIERSAFGLACMTAAVTTLAGVGLAPLFRPFLHLGTPLPAVWLGLSLLPLTLAGAFEGHLLGREEYGRFAVAVSVIPLARFAAGAIAAHAHWGVTGVLAATAAAAYIATVGVAALARGPSRPDVAGGLGHVSELLRACSTMTGLLLLTNVDVLLARHYFSGMASGNYALASLFAKAAFWGSQFIPLLFFPALARRSGRRNLLVLSAACTAALGGLWVVVTAVVAAPLLEAATGDAYSAVSAIAWRFALLGTGWALIQLLLFSALAIPDRSFNRLLWMGVVMQVALIVAVLHGSIDAVLLACGVTAVALLLAVALAEARALHRSLDSTGEPVGDAVSAS